MLQRVNFRGFFLATAVLIGACGDDDGATPDGGSDVDAGAESCTIPDTTCPEDQPFAGAACATSETCMYPELIPMGGMDITWTYTCVADRWQGVSDCKPAPGGACPVGPLAEGCRMPFGGTVSGATVQVGPGGSGAFRTFMPDEEIDVIVGGQGSPMLSLRLHVDGADIPSCVNAITTLTVDGTAGAPQMRPIVLHCGDTLSFFQILSENCDETPLPLHIEIELVGIGTATADVIYMGGPCFG